MKKLRVVLLTYAVAVSSYVFCENPDNVAQHLNSSSAYASNAYFEFISTSTQRQFVDTGIASSDGDEQQVQVRKAMKTTVETSFVAITKINGIHFHIADYVDRTRVITCLDGGLKGYQEVYVNGIFTAYSSLVEWHKDYFIHRYPTGKVYSYKHKQKIEIK